MPGGSGVGAVTPGRTGRCGRARADGGATRATGTTVYQHSATFRRWFCGRWRFHPTCSNAPSSSALPTRSGLATAHHCGTVHPTCPPPPPPLPSPLPAAGVLPTPPAAPYHLPYGVRGDIRRTFRRGRASDEPSRRHSDIIPFPADMLFCLRQRAAMSGRAIPTFFALPASGIAGDHSDRTGRCRQTDDPQTRTPPPPAPPHHRSWITATASKRWAHLHRLLHLWLARRFEPPYFLHGFPVAACLPTVDRRARQHSRLK